MPLATNLGLLSGRLVQFGSLDRMDNIDYYRFQTTTNGDLSVTVAGLSSNANLWVIRDFNGNGIVDPNEVIGSSANLGSDSESVNLTNLNTGTYFVAIGNQVMGNTNYALTLTSDSAGETLSQARNLETLTGSRTINEFIGGSDTSDFYRFQLNTTSDLTVSLGNLSADADVYLIQDSNLSGTIDPGEIVAYSARYGDRSDEFSVQGLTAGNYYLWVNPFQGSTNYSLAVLASPSEPGNSLSTASELGILTGQLTVADSVTSTDTGDFYRFYLNTTSDLRLNLRGLTSDADLYLIQDANQNGQIDTGEILGSSFAGSTTQEIISLNNMAAGTYFVGVQRYAGRTNYTLELTADGAGETFSTARTIGLLNGSRYFRDFVGDLDSNDYYRFQTNTVSNLNITLSNLTADADLYLIQDGNNNGIADPGEILAASFLSGSANDTIRLSNLAAGSYLVRVNQYSGNTNYVLNLTTEAVGGLQVLSGTFGADTFRPSSGIARTAISGNGNVDFVSGARDVLDLSNIFSTSVSLNLASVTGGGVAFDLGTGMRLFDAINFSDGRQILFEGIDSIRFADGVRDLFIAPNDPLFNQQWNLHMMGVHNAWRFTTGSTNVAIGVQDTGLGIDSNGGIHPDLRSDNTTSNSETRDDFFYTHLGVSDTSHGTAVQGIIAAATNNGVGLSGINWNSPVINLDVLGDNLGDLSLESATRDMINTALSRGQRLIINMSLEGDAINPALEQLIAQYQDSVLFVIAAGNNDRNSLSYPASLAQRFSNVIAVGASWGQQDRNGNARIPGTRISYPDWWGSNYGGGLSLMAPSEVITTDAVQDFSGVTFRLDQDFNGTSAAAPNVAGVASLVWSINPNLTATQVHHILQQTATDLGIPGRDLEYGNGFVNADAAVRRAIALTQGLGSLDAGSVA
jgi:hypothetical protein